MQVSTAEFKKGLKIQFDGQPYTIVDFQHVKPGKGGAFVRTKLKHMRQGRVIDNTFRAGEKVELVDFEEKHMQYLYKDDRYNFMDTETYDQISLSSDEVGDARDFLKENTEVDILFIDGSPVTVELPNFLELQIAKTDPGIRGDTASGGYKPATLETGAVIQVPLFLNEGDIVKVDTRSWRLSGPRRGGGLGPWPARRGRPAARRDRSGRPSRWWSWRWPRSGRARDREHGAARAGGPRSCPGDHGRSRPRGARRPLPSRSGGPGRRHGPGAITIEAPMVGTFYRATDPEATPFVSEGDTVKEGQTLCIIEAMKLMNEIESKVAGRVVKILVENAQPVEFGQPLFLVEPRR